jgi:hypothetical protein
MRTDAVARQPQSLDDRLVGFQHRGLDLGTTHLHRHIGEVETVESFRVFRHGRVAARLHVVEDRAHGRVHILRDFALGGQQRPEAGFEIV